jgi:hypothetical protein
MTLNQVVQKLEQLALSHKQINHFFFGEVVDWLANGDIRYPACCVEVNPSTISKDDHQTIYSFEIWFLDLVNVDMEANENELEVMSDLTSIAEDYIAMLNFTQYQDIWTIGTTYQLEYFREKFEDLTIAVRFTCSIGVDNTTDRCQVPATGVTFESGTEYPPQIQIQENTVYTYTYIADGSEGDTLSAADVVNKDVLLVFVGDKRLNMVASNPEVNEYTYDDDLGVFTFGVDLQDGQVIQILYR